MQSLNSSIGFQDLPTEITVSIFKYLKPRQTLQIRAVCVRFNEIVEEFFKKSFHENIQKDFKAMKGYVTTQAFSIKFFECVFQSNRFLLADSDFLILHPNTAENTNRLNQKIQSFISYLDYLGPVKNKETMRSQLDQLTKQVSDNLINAKENLAKPSSVVHIRGGGTKLLSETDQKVQKVAFQTPKCPFRF